jgi:hypothetical protein
METTGYASRQDSEALRLLNKFFIKKEGYYWFIENKKNKWLCGDGSWTNDPHKCLKFDLEHHASTYCSNNCPYPERLEYKFTEHEFVSTK